MRIDGLALVFVVFFSFLCRHDEIGELSVILAPYLVLCANRVCLSSECIDNQDLFFYQTRSVGKN